MILKIKMTKIITIESAIKRIHILNYIQTGRHPAGSTISAKVILRKTASKFELVSPVLQLRATAPYIRFICLL